jgi:hypothetical protein
MSVTLLGHRLITALMTMVGVVVVMMMIKWVGGERWMELAQFLSSIVVLCWTSQWCGAFSFSLSEIWCHLLPGPVREVEAQRAG